MEADAAEVLQRILRSLEDLLMEGLRQEAKR